MESSNSFAIQICSWCKPFLLKINPINDRSWRLYSGMLKIQKTKCNIRTRSSSNADLVSFKKAFVYVLLDLGAGQSGIRLDTSLPNIDVCWPISRCLFSSQRFLSWFSSAVVSQLCCKHPTILVQAVAWHYRWHLFDWIFPVSETVTSIPDPGCVADTSRLGCTDAFGN